MNAGSLQYYDMAVVDLLLEFLKSIGISGEMEKVATLCKSDELITRPNFFLTSVLRLTCFFSAEIDRTNKVTDISWTLYIGGYI